MKRITSGSSSRRTFAPSGAPRRGKRRRPTRSTWGRVASPRRAGSAFPPTANRKRSSNPSSAWAGGPGPGPGDEGRGPPGAGERLHRMRILVVDDEPMVAALIADGLRDEGYEEIVIATSGPEGPQVIERDSPDVVFLDITMPGMDDR